MIHYTYLFNRLSNFIISFSLNTLSKILGLIKAYVILRFLGTTADGDLYRAAYSFPNLIRRITMDGALYYAILPFFLEVSKPGEEEELSRRSRLMFRLIFSIGFITIFIYNSSIAKIAPNFITTLPESVVKKTYIMFGILLLPMGLIGLLTTICNSREDFKTPNLAAILGNIIFFMFFFLCAQYIKGSKLEVMGIALMFSLNAQFVALMLGTGSLSKNFPSQQKAANEGKWGILKISLETLKSIFIPPMIPWELFINIIKSVAIQLCYRANHIVTNIIGSRIGEAGTLMAIEFCDRIIVGIISLLAITVATVAMPIFYRAVNNQSLQDCDDSSKIIIASFTCSVLIAAILSILSSEIITFIVGNRPNINNILISKVLSASAWQIPLSCLVRLFNALIISSRRINFALYSGIAGSFVATIIELGLYKKLGVYGMILGQYSFLLVELVVLITVILSNKSLGQILKKSIRFAPTLKLIAKLSFLISILFPIGQLLRTKSIILNHFKLSSLVIGGIYGILAMRILFAQIKIFILKNKPHNV